jgi:NADH dehydrogenase FAD-containing subunit
MCPTLTHETMTMRIRISMLAAAIGAALAAAQTAQAQRGAPVDTTAVVGKYEFSLNPQNGEPITGTLTVRVTKGGWRAVVTSPKLAEPEEVDEIRVSGSEVHTAMLGGAYTFDFTVEAAGVRAATFTKTMRGTTESGTLRIKKAGAGRS